jgi:PleD family two-component response regulator
MLLSGAGEDDAVMIINRISQLVSQIKITEDENIETTNSGGVTTFHGTESPPELIANASKALAFAVEQGRDRVAGFLYEVQVVEDITGEEGLPS